MRSIHRLNNKRCLKNNHKQAHRQHSCKEDAPILSYERESPEQNGYPNKGLQSPLQPEPRSQLLRPNHLIIKLIRPLGGPDEFA